MGYRGYNPDRSYHFTRKSLRLKKYDYSQPGAYFVTICLKRPELSFDIPKLRTILLETWRELALQFPSITLDEFVVMPDHVHFIVFLNETVEKPPTLGDIVQAYKSKTTVTWLNHIKTSELEYPGQFWQRNYFEHIIRDPEELEDTREYIRNNPTKLQTGNTKPPQS